MKRITAIFFVLIATLSLLAHAVIPHHHHDRMVVAHHHHDGHQHGHQSEDCLLSDNLFLIIRGEESDSYSSDDGQDNVTTYGYAVVGETFRLPQLPDIPILFYTYQASIPPGDITCSNGLRAPPYC